MRAWITGIAALLIAAAGTHAQPVDPGLSPAVVSALRNEADARPRLVVVISIDQFRGDYLTRLHDLFGEEGFRRLTTGGAWFVNAHHSHYPATTAPGHAVLLTGAAPYKSGIIANDWWDPAVRDVVHAVEDPRSTVVGADPKSKEEPSGPRNLRSTTVGDELKLATGGRARAVSISLKDRAAILMGGHAADTCIWFDDVGGRWISSSAYCKDGRLPAWVEALNDEKIPAKSLGTQWTSSLTAQTLKERSLVPHLASKGLPKGFGTAFPHSIGQEDATENYTAFTCTPAANAFVFQTAKRAVVEEKLGQRVEGEDGEVPDILTISLSTNDYIGHTFGPYSPEAVDLMVRTDGLLGDFLKFLDDKVGTKVLVVLSGDHGVSPIPEDVSAELGAAARRIQPRRVVTFISDTLTARYGQPEGDTWFSVYGDPRKRARSSGGTYIDGAVYLSVEAVDALLVSGRIKSRRDIEEVVCDAVNGAGLPGVYGCFGKRQILEGRIADNALRRHLSLGIHPQLSADLFILQDQFSLNGEGSSNVTSHSTPYAYDTHVPIVIYQPGLIKPGVFAQRVSTMDIAPTLSLLLGTEFPSGCDGQPLLPALAK